MKKKVLALLTMCLLLASISMQGLAHSGRTDASGGHKDNKNKSGLGGYHYHCGGYPAHLHSGGVCPYKGGTSSGSSSSAPKTIYASKVNVKNMPTSMNVDDSIQLKGEAYPSNAEDQEIRWESSDSSIASVDAFGNLTAVGVGAVTIRAITSRGTTSSYKLTVQEVVAESIEILGATEQMYVGEQTSLTVRFIPENVTFKDVEWSSADTSVASVSPNGVMQALKPGKTTITLKHKELTDSFEVEVLPVLAERIDIYYIAESGEEKSDEFSFETGKSVDLKVRLHPANVTDKTVTWSVDAPELAEVTQEGVFTALKAGEVQLTVETTNGLKKVITIETKSTLVVDILAWIFVFIILAAVIGGPIALVIWIVKRVKRKKND